MFFLIVAAVLVASPILAEEYDLKGDANIYDYALQALQELEVQRTEEAWSPEVVIQRASSVCYDELGCFDKEGTFKHLKQLPEPPETVNTQFLLYTKKNKMVPQMLDYKKPETILNSNLDPSKPLKFITHGFGGKNNLTWVFQMKNAFMEKQDLNVIVVDWSLGARVPYYVQAAVNTELVGAEIGVMYYFIKDNFGIQEKDLHVIGFSLGAQVMGFVGKRMMELRGTRPSRATGLDPASPLFENYGEEVHLDKEDADFVDVIHTNADLFIYGGVGMETPIGHVDFYPNGGKRQPGCGSTIAGALGDIFNNKRGRTCNHERAVHLFTDSILNPEGCQFVGYKCSSYKEFEKGNCMSCGDDCGKMGYNVQGTGTYYLMTKEKAPFCSSIAKLTVQFANKTKKSYGSIIITLVGANGERENVTVTQKDEKLLPGSHRTMAISLPDRMMPLKSVEALYLRYSGWLGLMKGAETFTLGYVNIEDSQGNELVKSCTNNFVLKHEEYRTVCS